MRHARDTVYPKKYAHGFCFAVLCCGYTLTDFPISIRLTSLALWQSNDCPSASKATQMNMDKYFMWINYERLHNHIKAKHNKTVCIFLGIYCMVSGRFPSQSPSNTESIFKSWGMQEIDIEAQSENYTNVYIKYYSNCFLPQFIVRYIYVYIYIWYDTLTPNCNEFIVLSNKIGMSMMPQLFVMKF